MAELFMNKKILKNTVGLCLSVAALWAVVGCSKQSASSSETREVVVYTSWDKPHSQLILAEFEKQTGIKVKPVYDTEASKTAGLVNRLIAEKNNPMADVFWNSEIVRTLVLKKKGILAPYKPSVWNDTPEAFRDADGYWTGFGGRSRVLLYNIDLVEQPPVTLEELTDPKWKGKLTIANPLFGTTSTDVATWYSDWTAEGAQSYLKALVANEVKISTGNATAKDMVAAGEIPLCLTDTDDALGAMRNGKPVDLVFLDQEGDGALLIPNTVCLIKGAKHEVEAKALIDFLTSREVEAMLAQSRAGQIPLKADVPAPEPVASWAKMRFRQVDFEHAHGQLEAAMQFVREEFLR